MRLEGWRPKPIITAVEVTVENARHECINGHQMDESDLICVTCGADQAELAVVQTPPVSVRNEGEKQVADGAVQETVIDGWRLLNQIGATPRVRDRYVAERISDSKRAVLTLYQHGSEPDPAIYEVFHRLPRNCVPEIYATGRWSEKAYEIVEEFPLGSLDKLGIVATDINVIRGIVSELGGALHAFSEVGLRHRDLRPATLLVRNRDPLDLVIGGFGSARLSEFDLDIVSPLEVTRYMAPEAIAGGVAAASDWWSLGMVLLEQLTNGKCFEGVNERAFLIHVLANGVSLPEGLDPSLNILLRGLLARDRHERWQWEQVRKWIAGEPVAAPEQVVSIEDDPSGSSIRLGEKTYRQPAIYALSAAEAQNWSEARDQLVRGSIATWVQEIGIPQSSLAGIRHVAQFTSLDEDFRLMVALKILNPEIPLIHKGEIVTPRWLLDHPREGYELIVGAVPGLLEQINAESWLSRLKSRADAVRNRAKNLGIDLDEDALRVNVLSTSRARLAAIWEERRRLLPDTSHRGLQNIAERGALTEEDLIVLLSASISLYRSCDVVLVEARDLALKNEISGFDMEDARKNILLPRLALMQAVADRSAGFARCRHASVNEWVEHFRLERRMPLVRALVVLAIPTEEWTEPEKQQYLATLLNFFETRITTTVMRGPLVRMTIGKTTARIDLSELGTDRVPSATMLGHLLQRNQQAVQLDPLFYRSSATVEDRLHLLSRNSALYRRDTGIDGLYMGFPFLLVKEDKATTKTRIAPLLLWPIRIDVELSNRRTISLSFDSDREEVRLNPALEGMIGIEGAKRWAAVKDEILARSDLRAADVMDAFGMLAGMRSAKLEALPGPKTELERRGEQLACAAVLFHVSFIGQAIGNDLRQLKERSAAGTGLETVMRLNSAENPSISSAEVDAHAGRELERFFTVSSDPSQEAAVLQSRQSPGLLVEGPPGTGKSQTIVNMVGDAIGRRKSLLIVCQKRAALEVVHKRLVAEGLGDRVVMLNDINKDRTPIIKAIREQVDAIHRRTTDPCASIRRRRETVAARIEALEGELDRHHAALHRIDELVGMSYRSLLGELIALESPAPPIDVPELRAHLQKLTVGELATLEEEMAPVARHWLPACFEGSPLSQLLPFSSDQATIAAFKAAFSDFFKKEGLRVQVMRLEPMEFDIDDPTRHRLWLSEHAHKFLDLNSLQRVLLARWLPFIRSNVKSGPNGRQLLEGLVDLVRRLDACASQRHETTLSPILSGVDGAFLKSLVNVSDSLVRKAAWWSVLNPFRIFRKWKVNRFLRRHNIASTDERVVSLNRAGKLELEWRPLRAALTDAHEKLRLPAIPPDSGLALRATAVATERSLRQIIDLADYLGTSLLVDRLDAAAKQGDRAAMEKEFALLDTAFARFEARQSSLAVVDVMTSWATPEWVAQCRNEIIKNASNASRISTIFQAMPSLAAYQYFRGRAQRLSELALRVFAVLRSKEVNHGKLPPEDLDGEVRRILNREARLGWKRQMEQNAPDLELEFSELQSKVANLEAADADMRELNRELLKNDFDLQGIKRPNDWDDITRLTGQRARRLREFIERGAGMGLMKVRPVWLMNPDVASRVLPLKPSFFDAVIYDEASQMPVEHALPTLFRGAISVVSGDEKQMPPTAFFASKVESDEAELFDGETLDEDATEEEREAFEETWNRREIKDCPDLLQLARSSLPNATLKIHYRSEYRELIGFSNACFYGNQLSVPVRHSEDTIRRFRPIQVVRTDSIYQEQTNPGEAEKVVEILTTLWKRPYQERPSVGVVTFNRKQADLIEELIEKTAEGDPVFMEAYRQERERRQEGEDMSVFVKNVENVQGDERDIIIFSSTFGRNSQGTFRRNFGVLGQKGGERRLNVAVTRARRKVIMVTSMPVGDISDVLITHRPPSTPRDFLQGYMEYARALSGGEFETTRALLQRMKVARDDVSVNGSVRLDDGFSQSVAEFINSMGCKITTPPERDAFGLDFAVENPKTGLFAIGIECDAPSHELLVKARAREIWRPSVLRRAIPVIHRVLSTAWYHNPTDERERLRSAITGALNQAETL